MLGNFLHRLVRYVASTKQIQNSYGPRWLFLFIGLPTRCRYLTKHVEKLQFPASLKTHVGFALENDIGIFHQRNEVHPDLTRKKKGKLERSRDLALEPVMDLTINLVNFYLLFILMVH